MTADTAAQGTDWTPLRDALESLAAVCDGAEERDFRGFSAADVPDGHYLAALPVAEWTDVEARVGHHLARVYRKQLDRAFGIDFEALPVPPRLKRAPAGGERGIITLARRTAARRKRLIAAARCWAMVDRNGLPTIQLSLPEGLGLTAEARMITGFRHVDRWGVLEYAPTAKAAAALIEFCEHHEIAVDATVREIERFVAKHAARAAARKAEREVRFGPNLLRDEAGGLVIKFDGYPGSAAVDLVKDSIPGRRWDDGASVWRLPDSSLIQAVAVAKSLKLRIAEELLEQVRRESERRAANRTASIALIASGPAPVIPGLVGTLKPHQGAGLEFISINRRVLVGDKMGLGKTLTSLAAVVQAGTWPAVVVCKTSLRENWRSEVERFFPDLAVTVAEGTVPGAVPAGTDVVVIGFDVLREKASVKRRTVTVTEVDDDVRPSTVTEEADGVERVTVTATERVDGVIRQTVTVTVTEEVDGWLPSLLALAPRALIVDESQYGKEDTALRSRAMEALAAAIPPDGLVLCLSGTAILNRPKELVQQLKILGRLDGEFGGEKPFLYRYCDPEFNDFGARFHGASNLEELHALLRETGIYLRRGDEALNLPELTISPRWLETSELDQRAMAAYHRAEDDFLSEWVAHARRNGVDLSDPAELYDFCARAMSAKVLVELNLLRQLTGEAKRPAVTGQVRALVKAREKVMIAAHHRASVAAYTKAFGRLRIQGGQSPASIEADKAAFQNLPVTRAPVITVSTQAGGVGHTLTAAAHGVMAEVPWTWAEIEQMAARLHRIGQARPVEFTVVLAAGTVDAKMWQIVTHKRGITHAVLDAPDAHLRVLEQEGDDERDAAVKVMALMFSDHARANKIQTPRRRRRPL